MTEEPPESNRRTLQQNKALHLYFQFVSDTLNENGLDLRAVLKPGIDIPWTPIMVKEIMWKTVLRVMKKKEHTADMTTKEIDEIFEVMNRHLSLMGITVSFPSLEELMLLQSKDYGMERHKN